MSSNYYIKYFFIYLHNGVWGNQFNTRMVLESEAIYVILNIIISV